MQRFFIQNFCRVLPGPFYRDGRVRLLSVGADGLIRVPVSMRTATLELSKDVLMCSFHW